MKRSISPTRLAPKTTGIKLADQAASLELARRALDVARETLCPGGRFVCKVFESGEVAALKKSAEESFASVRLHKPKASRSESFEIFLVALSLKSVGAGG